jgi:hypothetical protein
LLKNERKETTAMSEVIKHHGILGMKWGIRRTPAQLGKVTGSKGTSGDAGEGRAKKAASSSSNRTSHMTDEELRSRISRLSLEKQYRDLEAAMTPQKEYAVKKWVGETLKTLGKKATEKVADLALNKIFREKADGSTLSDFMKKDLSEMTPGELKKAKAMVDNAGALENYLKKLSGKKKES